MSDETFVDHVHVAPIIHTSESEQPRYFSLSQRLGRMRYFVYSLSGIVCCSVVLVFIYLFCLAMSPAVGKLIWEVSLTLIKNVLMPMIVFVMTIRRLHDINAAGWWSLFIIIPFATCVLLLIPGSPTDNRFGPPPRENTSLIKITTFALPALLVFMFLLLRNSPPHTFKQTPAAPGLKTYPQ
ncbi:MAG TPA: DUF805 domain-containing protein [Rhodocyclaceae bacterium]|jgi:uncharacterized membrane protein YhaH (DUF805 family)|nr:DUF805 domain-containing protein [Rhodocyclaceae bacterium]